MARRDFIINEKGELQRPLKFNIEDTVCFHAYESDVVLYFVPAVFGAIRIEILKGAKVTLEVDSDIPQDFTFQLYCCSDLTYKNGDPVVPGKGSSNTGGPVG